MKNKVNIEELSSIIKSARKYSLLGEYGNSLEKYQEAVSIIKQRQEEIKDDNDNIKDVEEMLDNDFLGKKTKTSNKKLVSEKKEGKISTKRKKVIDDSDEDMDDEDFKL